MPLTQEVGAEFMSILERVFSPRRNAREEIISHFGKLSDCHVMSTFAVSARDFFWKM
jgi:hypothetical protein